MGEAAPVYVRDFYPMPAVNGLCGAAAFKIQGRFKIRSHYPVRFKERDGQRRHLRGCHNSSDIFAHQIAPATVNLVMPVLEMKGIHAILFKIGRPDRENIVNFKRKHCVLL